jgi:hypothetical protein
MGFDFSAALSGSSSLTIASGQSAGYKLMITPLLGSQGTFTFQCGSLPSHSSCTFNPTSKDISANTSDNEEVDIATGLSTSARFARPSTWPALPLACGLVLVPFALMRRREALMLVVLLAILAGGVSSCTSSSVDRSSNPNGGSSGITPAGTYSIPVTVTSNGVQHQVTLTLIVD